MTIKLNKLDTIRRNRQQRELNALWKRAAREMLEQARRDSKRSAEIHDRTLELFARVDAATDASRAARKSAWRVLWTWTAIAVLLGVLLAWLTAP